MLISSFLKFLSHVVSWCGLLFLLLGANSATANSRNEGWYQVEMIVFARRNPTSDEHYPKSIKLRYPARWVELKDPNAAPVDTITGAAPAPIDFTTESFWQLPTTERSLNDQARALDRNPNFQLLFHQAWRQQISGPRNPSNILISGGRTFGKHFELEGNISLSVATYLKITTNLWFTQFDVNVDNAASENIQETWPDLPLRPNYGATTSTLTLNSNLENLDEATANINAVAEESAAPYKPRFIALVKQERDMRSNEVHYLDHPLLGVIIKIKPYRI